MADSKQNNGICHILFYDGDCGLCTRSVRFFLKVDQAKCLHYAPLQGDTAKTYLPEHLRDTSCLSTVVYLRGAPNQPTLHVTSEAVAFALVDVGGVWRWIGQLIRSIPTPIREWGYRWIARNRLRFFPQGACKLPTAEERARLLP
jgi:predicted DCC family thiol-disulfide oxidoreductase YuxK